MITKIDSTMRIQETVRIPVESYRIKEQISDKTGKVENVYLEGVAITFDKPTRNRVSYTYESGVKKAETLIGKPFLDTHNDSSIRDSPPFGHVEDAYMGVDDNGMNILNYRVNLDPEEKVFIHKAKRGDIPGVSIQVLVDGVQETEDLGGDEFIQANISEFLELSAVLIPGDGDSSMSFVEKFKTGKLMKFKEGVVDVDTVPGKDGAFVDNKSAELDGSNGDALIGDELPDKIKPAPEPYERQTQLAKIGLKCPVCSTQLLEDKFIHKENKTVDMQLRCYKCNYTIIRNLQERREALKDALYRLKFEVRQ